jgi:IS5 family transposase
MQRATPSSNSRIKVRYRRLKKNTGQFVTLFAIANLWLARGRLLPSMAEVRP